MLEKDNGGFVCLSLAHFLTVIEAQKTRFVLITRQFQVGRLSVIFLFPLLQNLINQKETGKQLQVHPTHHGIK